MLIALWLTVTTIWVHAQSFWSDAMVIKTDTAKECQSIGWIYTEINTHGSCTNIPSHVLTKLEHMQTTLSVKRLTKLASADKVVYTKLMTLLEAYKLEFIQNKDVKRLAIAMLLTQDIKNTAAVVPLSCSVRFDGCNTCQVMDNGELACILMYCHENESPECLQHK